MLGAVSLAAQPIAALAVGSEVPAALWLEAALLRPAASLPQEARSQAGERAEDLPVQALMAAAAWRGSRLTHHQVWKYETDQFWS